MCETLSGYYENWNGKWLDKYFYTQNRNDNKIILNTRDDINTFTNKIKFKNSAISIVSLINSSIEFFEGFSISEKIQLKGVALFIVAFTNNFDSKEIDRKMRQNKVAALIVQLGKTEKKLEIIKQSKYLKILKMNIEEEFYDNFFQNTFSRIRTELKLLMKQHEFKFRFM